MKKTIIYLFAILSIIVFSNIDSNAATPAKKSSSNSSVVSYENCNYSDLKFEKTSNGYVSPQGHTYYAVENETSLKFVFNNNNTCTIYFEDGGNKNNQTVRYTQSKNVINLSGFGTGTIMDNGRQIKTSDGLTFIIIK